MATLIEIHNTLNHPAIKARTKAAILLKSVAVQSEDIATANHTERLAMANKALSDSLYLESATNVMMYSMATNDQIASNPDDTSPGNADDTAINWVVDQQYTNCAINNPPA